MPDQDQLPLLFERRPSIRKRAVAPPRLSVDCCCHEPGVFGHILPCPKAARDA